MLPEAPRGASETPDGLTTNLSGTGHASGEVPLVDGATSGAESLIRLLRAVVWPAATPPTAFPLVPDYTIERELGRGGMGVVYEARHVPLNRVVALKMIVSTEPASPGEVARFRAEAEAVAAVRHPNVVQVFELCPAGCNVPYFTMEYVEGGSLAKLLKAHVRLDPRAAAGLIAAVADGLQAAHDAGIVHRDVKPGNILLHVTAPPRTDGTAPRPADCQPKVSDFGLAKRLAADATRTQDMKGTPAYMAPEQAGGRARYVGPGADVYALGAVLYECLTGRPPFDDVEPLVIVRNVLETRPPAPRTLVPAVPRDLELICLTCLEKEPQHRYPTAAALAEDLRRFVDGRPVSVRPIGPVTRAARWARRRPAPAALVLLTAALLFVVPPVVVWGRAQLGTHAARAEAAHERERAAVRLADAQELFAIRSALRTRAADRPLSWAAANRAVLHRAVTLAGGEATAVNELRSAAVTALLAADLDPPEPVQQEFTGAAMATNPRTGRVAVGEHLTWAPVLAQVRIVDPSGHVERRLTFEAAVVRDPEGNPRGQPDSVRSLAFSPCGTRLFVGTRSSHVIRFNLDRPGNKEGKRWLVSAGPVDQLAVSPDGSIVYGLCGAARPVLAWNAETGAPVAKLEPAAAGSFTSFTVLASGEVLACGPQEVRRWTAGHKLVQTVRNAGAGRLAVTPSGGLLAGAGRHLDVYDPVELTPLDRFATAERRHGVHEEPVRALAVHPSGAFVATASGDADRTLRVWELASCRHVGTVTVKGTGPIAVAWSGDGTALFATAHGHVSRWSFCPAPAQQFACFSAAPVAAAAVGPDGRIAALTEPTGGRYELLVGAAGAPAGIVRFTDRGGNGRPGVAIAPQGWIAVTAAPPGIVACAPGGPAPPAGFVTSITWCPRFGPGGSGSPLWAVVDSSELCSFDPVTKRVRTKWRNWLEGRALGLASLDALAVGRTVVAAGGRSGSVHVFRADRGQFVGTVMNSGDPVQSLAVPPDEALIVAGTQSGNVRAIRTADRAELPFVPAHPDAVTALSFNHDGTLLATGGRDRSVRFWKRAGEQFEPLFTVADLAGPVRELQFHPSDNRLLVLVSQERAVRVWDVERLKAQLAQYELAW